MNRNAGSSEAHETWRFDGFELSLLRGLSPERDRWERQLIGAGVPLPLPHRASWALLQPRSHENWLLCVRDSAGQPVGAAAVHVAPSRALPGHKLLRVERFGHGFPADAYRAALHVLISLARREPRVLRLYVESFAIDAAPRELLERELETLGFARMKAPRCYEDTLVLSLEGDEDAIFASLHRTGRQNIRSAAKRPIRIQPIVDPAEFSRLDEISVETFARTGGKYDPPDWSRIVALCDREPRASRLVGLYRTDVAGPAGLLAFARACGHGDHAHYASSGSTRAVEGNIPLIYPLLWDLILWAKRSGARFFDFGGVTAGNQESDDRLGGISDFKRRFTKQLAHVGAEWSFEPRPMHAHAARMVQSASSLVSRVLARA